MECLYIGVAKIEEGRRQRAVPMKKFHHHE
jgi:hypothetical protein